MALPDLFLKLSTCGMAFISASVLVSPLHAQAPDTVWVWNARCREPIIIALRVRLDRVTVYRTSIPICRWVRDSENGRGSFRFTPSRPLVWYGYRSDEGNSTRDVGDTTPANTPFEVDLWQAGGETDAVELGYSVAASDGLHMNAIHLLSPTKASTTTMAPGLLLETWPEPSKGRRGRLSGRWGPSLGNRRAT